MNLYQQMMETAVNAGLAVMPKDKAAKILAACYVYGDEPFVLTSKLHTDTMLAARVLQMEPGAIPPQESKKKLNRYYREIVNSVGKIPDWLSELGKEYGVDFPPYRRGLNDGGLCVSESIHRKAGRRQSARRRGRFSATPESHD